MPITILDHPLHKIFKDHAWCGAPSEDTVRASVRRYPAIIIPLESISRMTYIG
ncbi:MAG: hypothetical protein ABSG44_07330 [Thermodesulfobacteriota bacterium]